MQQLFIDL